MKKMFKSLSEMEDTKQYIENVITEMKQSNPKTGSSKSD